jgi:glycosyltransferase involved in cell wall biosynthesis
MRIAINGLFWRQEATGSGQYTSQLLRALRELAPEHEYLLLTTREAGSPVPGSPARVRSLRTPFTGRSANLDKLWFEQVAFPQACRTMSIDLAHVPYWGSPLSPTVPTVVTVHDLIPMLLPLYRGSFLVRSYTALVAASARRAAAIITDSLASKEDIARLLHIPPGRVHAIYLAADPSCQPVSDPGKLAAVRARYLLPEQYILYLGGFDQRKNLRTLLEAYARMQAQEADAPALVVAGRVPSIDTTLFPNPQRMARELDIENHVIFTGWIPESDKSALYSGALFLAFLSLYEGFGLMPLEAMACGTPVLAARTSSLPEVVGEGGLLVDPSEPEQVVRGMRTLLHDSAGYQTLRHNALTQAARFSWRRAALQTLDVYNQIASDRGTG